MIPIVPIFYLLVTPLVCSLIEDKKWKRIAIFVVINIPLLFFTSFNIAQNNLIGLVKFVEKSQKIEKYYRLVIPWYYFQMPIY